jgi:NTE family protein
MNERVSAKLSLDASIEAQAQHKSVSLALQGGGSHGAFTWGVLDQLLEDGRLELDGISGASAGAMNAVVMGHGFAQHPDDPAAAREAAREALGKFWRKIAQMGEASKIQNGWAQMWLSGWRASGVMP